MKYRMLLVLMGMGVVLLVGSSCPAQEKLPPPEPGPRTVPDTLPPALLPPPLMVPLTFGPCLDVRWAEHDVPLQSLRAREVLRLVEQPTLEVAYREQKKVITEVVIKSRQVEQQVLCTVMREVQVTDPVTGHCSTVLQPCTEVKVVKDIVYEAVPEERTVVVKCPYLRQTTEKVPVKDLLLEYRTEFRKEGFPVVVPGNEIPPRRVLLAPKLPCDP